MAASNRLASFLATMKWEGGDRLSRDRRDPGNWTGGKAGVGVLKGTKWGVSASAHPSLDIAELTAEEALSIFLADYWRPIGADDLPPGLDHCASDDAYNSGPGAALRRLAKIKTDGANLSVASRIRKYSLLRLSFLESLKGWRIFGRGWARRVAGIEAESLKMALAAHAEFAPSPDAVEALINRDSLVTPADLPSPRRMTAKRETINQAHRGAEEAGADARRRAAMIAAASVGAAPWHAVLAPVWLISLVVLATALLAAQLWAWRAHSARRDALASLRDALVVPGAD